MEKCEVIFCSGDYIVEKALELGVNIEYIEGDRGGICISVMGEIPHKYLYKPERYTNSLDHDKLFSDIFGVEVYDSYAQDGDQDFPKEFIIFYK
jgi:hypothetical protein